MKKIKEQINYGGRPERMDPNLERKLGDPQGLYAQNPAMKKGPQDVQRLVSSRFQTVAQKLRQVTGVEEITPQVFQRMLTSEMMRKTQETIAIESRHKDELEQLAQL